ncbi:MAG: hypothetical protein ACREIC_08880 [Limisphaerales bacterium]
MAPDIIQLSAHQLRRAAELKEKIESLQSELSGLLGAPSPSGGNGSARKHHMSAAAIARISAAQKARWAKIKKATGGKSAPQKGKRKMSAAGRARLAAIARARWKAAKASGKSVL